MTPAELYALVPESVTRDLELLKSWGYYDHVPEVNANCGAFQGMESPRIEFHICKEFWYDTRRYWRLASVWFDGKPVMVIRNAGREGDDFGNKIVTDMDGYTTLIRHLGCLLAERLKVNADTVIGSKSPDVDIPDLIAFYDGSLEGNFQRSKV